MFLSNCRPQFCYIKHNKKQVYKCSFIIHKCFLQREYTGEHIWLLLCGVFEDQLQVNHFTWPQEGSCISYYLGPRLIHNQNQKAKAKNCGLTCL